MCTTDILVMNTRIQLTIFFKYGLKDGDLYLTNFDNGLLDLVKILKKYLKKKILMSIIDCLISRNPLKIW